ncbi:hypothetical protein [Orenia marismortui]|uniref:Uncharacterized protein n=1 Tax=Orenia marismortui TaxID=46469 RepID=A0A4R8H332_9FIRM|nr:hypothetical protein [Orenia marismortui]TDX48854.1 hypothetical protein C7959_12533 [Orenia marismortui]
MMFFDLEALLSVTIVLIISFIIYSKDENRIIKTINFSQLLVWVITLGVAVVSLARLKDASHLGQLASYFTLSNFYMGILNVGFKIYNRFNTELE